MIDLLVLIKEVPFHEDSDGTKYVYDDVTNKIKSALCHIKLK